MTTRRAGCSCGQLHLTIEGEPSRISMCHCLECQRRTGAVISNQARFRREQVTFAGKATAWTRTAESGNVAGSIIRQGIELEVGSWRDVEEHAEICYRSRACGVHVKNIGCRRSVMHAVMRSYSGKGTKALFDLLEKNKGEVESLIRGVKGFVSYALVRTTRGGFSVSVYEDKAGADESSRAAREWIAKNASKTGVARPIILEGTVMLQLK